MYMYYTVCTCIEDGSLYICGCNAYGQCGLDKDDGVTNDNVQVNKVGVVTSVHVPIKVKLLPPVMEISCGWSHLIAITTG